jgi:hypothetical protein
MALVGRKSRLRQEHPQVQIDPTFRVTPRSIFDKRLIGSILGVTFSELCPWYEQIENCRTAAY